MTDAKLALVLCYFGPLPNYADLFFNSVRANPEIDFILVTDQLVKEPPANLKIKQLTLPAAMGEGFQAMGFARGVDFEHAFLAGDLSHRL